MGVSPLGIPGGGHGQNAGEELFEQDGVDVGDACTTMSELDCLGEKWVSISLQRLWSEYRGRNF